MTSLRFARSSRLSFVTALCLGAIATASAAPKHGLHRPPSQSSQPAVPAPAAAASRAKTPRTVKAIKPNRKGVHHRPDGATASIPAE